MPASQRCPVTPLETGVARVLRWASAGTR